MKELLARPIVDETKAHLKNRVQEFVDTHGVRPKLVVVLVGEDPASVIYTSRKGKAAVEVGMEHETLSLSASTSPAEAFKVIEKLNHDPKVHGILVQRPLPSAYQESEVVRWISPKKDVDAFHPENVGQLTLGLQGLQSCTPKGVMKILNHYGIETEGKTACVVGRSAIVGKPMAALLLEANATVIQCHSRTRDLAAMTRQADILIATAGKPKLIGPQHVKEGAAVIDVGIHRTESGKLCGDVDFDAIRNVAQAATPVPGGVGPMTISTLLENTLDAALQQVK